MADSDLTERRVASHPDDPEASFADRLLLALGMWPNYRETIGDLDLLDAAVKIRSDAHRYPMVCEDYGAKCNELDEMRADRDALANPSELADALRLELALRPFLDDDEAVSVADWVIQNPEAVEAAAFDHYAGHDCNDDPETE